MWQNDLAACLDPTSMKILAPKAYQPVARRTYLSLSRRIRTKLPTAKIEEIGSSAVRGLWSKGDLDIYVGVTQDEFPDAIETLKKMGFVEKRGTLRNKSLWPFVVRNVPIDVGIQLVALGSRFSFFITFRDQLRRSALLRADYNRLKIDSACLGPAAYRRAKARFIERSLSRARI
jgi:GrpB-like predicted nucleotidyltransferase (UPF0157 family)